MLKRTNYRLHCRIKMQIGKKDLSSSVLQYCFQACTEKNIPTFLPYSFLNFCLWNSHHNCHLGGSAQYAMSSTKQKDHASLKEEEQALNIKMKDGICQSAELWGTQQRVVVFVIKLKDLCPGLVHRVELQFSAPAVRGLFRIWNQYFQISFSPKSIQNYL